PAADGAGVLDLDLLVRGAGLLDDLDEIAQVLAYHRVLPGGDVLELVVQGVAVGAARIAGHHDEVTGLQRFAGQAQVLLRPVGHVVLGIRRRLAVGADVGTVEGEVAGVARPHPVVDLAAIVADAARRRVHQAHVADFQLAEQSVGLAAEEAVDGAAVARLGLALGDQALLRVLDGLLAVGAGEAAGGGLHLVSDFADAVHHVDAGAGTGRQFLGAAAGDEAVVDQVALGSGVELDGAVGAVVVGRHQALGRNETGGAEAQRDHGA